MAWYHGTDAALTDGTLLEAGDRHGRTNYPGGDSTHLWVCDDPDWAAIWAGAAVEMRGMTGPGFVYEVEPLTEPVRAATDTSDGPQFHTNAARIVRRVGLGQPGTPHVDEGLAWCSTEANHGYTIVTNSYDDQPDGVTFVSVAGRTGMQLGWWPVDAWADPELGASVMANIWATAAAGTTVWCDDYDVEYEVAFRSGALRACPHGAYVRIVGTDGDTCDDELAYWTADEWIVEPAEVMGAILGAVAALE